MSMRLIDLLRMSSSNLWKRKVRTILTVLGVVIGVAAIVVMVSLGLGLSKSLTEQYESYGSLTQVTVNPSWGSGPDGEEKRLDDKLVEQIKAAGLEMPASRYEFDSKEMTVYTLPEGTRLGQPLKYKDILRMGEDEEYFYLFRDENGGYMIPKKELGENVEKFRTFMKENGMAPSNHQAPLERIIQMFKSGGMKRKKSTVERVHRNTGKRKRRKK